ncbi:MAG: NADH pyrophosphatase NudC (nudix superfamily) [Oceanicoccus sp.]|jgi:NADH pyrophosphatase NudC (nudix superfamily)
MPPYNLVHCPQCGSEVISKYLDGTDRQQCSRDCGFVHWDNPVPVVAAIVEYNGQVLLARNAQWPPGWFALITGFLEKGETVEDSVLREVKEELNLDGHIVSFVGNYVFLEANQLLIVFHVKATGTISLNEELVEYKLQNKEDVVPWDKGTGPAIKDWLQAQLLNQS